MGYGRSYGLGFVGAKRQAVSGPPKQVATAYSNTSGFAKRPVPVVQVPPSAPVSVPVAPPRAVADRLSTDYEMFIAHDPMIASRYSPEQIREMLERGASETVERSGESDSGMPADSEMMQQSREADATDDFDAGTGTGYETVKTVSPTTAKNFLPLALLAAGLFFLG